MKNSKDTIAKGGSSLVMARLLGMFFSFLLFLFLARHSAADAGVFRTAVTYIVIAEFLSMLGLHRWLATEIAPVSNQRWPLFLGTTVFTMGISVILALIYIAISYGGFYSSALNESLRLAALAVIPSGIFACVQSALMGVGKSHMMGKLNMVENLARCLICFVLIYEKQPVIEIVWVFVIIRWCIAFYGFYYLSHQFTAQSWHPDKSVILQVAHAAPKFAVIIFAFLLLKNSALLLLPSLSSDAETAIFAVAYQLFDLILLIPSVLAITSSNKFADKANHSKVALKRASTQLISITALSLFPCIAITAAFAQNFLIFLYGHRYLSATNSLIILMIASGIMMIDQVLSQTMLARKDYKSDMISILTGGICTLLLTMLLAHFYGATGASFALLIALSVNVLTRLKLLHQVINYKLLALSIWRPTLASLFVYIICVIALNLTTFNAIVGSRYLWIICVPIALSFYAALIFLMNGITIAKRNRIKNFLFNH